MRKENILVVVLIAIALGGVFGYRALNPEMPSPAAVPADQAVASTVNTAFAAEAGGILWKDYTPGMALAKKEDKSIFLYFHAPWCTYCTKLKKTTFQDDRIQAYLNDNFVSIQVNTDTNKDLALKWQVKGLPTMWFLEPDGNKIDRMPGYVDAGQLLQILKYIHTKSYTTMEFNEFVKQG